MYIHKQIHAHSHTFVIAYTYTFTVSELYLVWAQRNS